VAEVVWSAAAERDIREIHDYIARDSPQYASLMIQRIREASSRLTRFPEGGRKVPESQPRIHREVIVHPHRIIYRYAPETNRVMIVRLVHGRRLLPQVDGAH
jgi:toxin ParE1/3/4